jgi:hypothetical protein
VYCAIFWTWSTPRAAKLRSRGVVNRAHQGADHRAAAGLLDGGPCRTVGMDTGSVTKTRSVLLPVLNTMPVMGPGRTAIGDRYGVPRAREMLCGISLIGQITHHVHARNFALRTCWPDR